ncbi:murein hydrolase activator NlpD [Affinibrenneria salicis]|uniref:Murein hydrolase activator NlpD n=1 Tax=Affinibrenneria salicis TaxID=2590031 RepID=A0A5J5FWA8_9GAMM|nr:murein hydrolase activator NlpD [Affinibrenneria salicis]KAA8997598.1 murein hydrolase activator NlpD [Affinibrenneria salicis]
MINLRQAAVCTAMVLGLAGCTNDNSASAPISSVGGSSGGSARGGMLSTPSSTPARSVASTGETTVATTQDGRIVYNRSYNNIPKGSYSGDTYTVRRGDTLFYIAWITGNDYRDLAQRNNIPEPYGLNVGQTLRLGNGSVNGPTIGGGGMLASSGSATNNAAGGVPQPPSSSQMQTTRVDSQPTNAYSDNSGKQNIGRMLPAAGAAAASSTPASTPAATASSQVSNTAAVSGWRWPTEGKVIDSFSAAEGGNKGIDIAGSRGQSVVATAGGRVVYAGNALRGYGNLIIIKHNDDYLSAYAHNDSMLVREQQEVKAGQQIATMGSTGTSSVRLHFEIRYKGKSVNPLRFLPQR